MNEPTFGSNGESDVEAGEKSVDSLPIADPNIVDWDGPDDPTNPLNWSPSKKQIHIAIVSLFSLNANLASTMFAPGAAQLASEFGITSSIVQALTVSLYVLGFAIGPLVLAPLSECYGRLPIYYLCNTFYLAFTAGCAFSTNTAMFLVFRFICGTAASGPMTIGGGTIADITPQAQRGKATALFAVGPLLGPVLGPIIGGFVTETVGWRWTFRIILILSGLIGVTTLLFMRETNWATLLLRKTVRLREETGNDQLVSKLAQKETPREAILRAIKRPLKLLIFSPMVLLISLYTGLLFGITFLLFTTFPSVFEDTYGFSTGIAGLAYLGLGLGFVTGLVVFSRLSDKQLRDTKDGSPPQPEQRLILMKWLGPISPLGIFLYGWTACYHVHWIVPILGTYIVGVGSLFVVIPGQIYLVDSFGAEAAASALAANLLVRSPFGAFLDLAAPPLYSKLGLGWGNSVLGFICLAFTPVPLLFHRYGESLRARFTVKL
ncbi:putative MFS transporter [Xylariomycetidae sp. FL2044]|nr:putative MFS transporter [Xylariomycetidae sp. FL2044]